MSIDGKHAMKTVAKLVLLTLLVLMPACRKMELGRQAYTIAVALDRVLEKQDRAQLTQATELIQAQQQSGELSAAEASELNELIAMAQADDWLGARAELRQLLVDQTDW